MSPAGPPAAGPVAPTGPVHGTLMLPSAIAGTAISTPPAAVPTNAAANSVNLRPWRCGLLRCIDHLPFSLGARKNAGRDGPRSASGCPPGARLTYVVATGIPSNRKETFAVFGV